MQITYEEDAFFLYTLIIGEDDYHSLKNDQKLRVDFHSFPEALINLVRLAQPRRQGRGMSREETSGPTYIAQLDTAGAKPSFSIIETNHFKEVTHLALMVRSGDDKAVKSYLAARLTRLKQRFGELSSNYDSKLSAIERER